MAAQAGDDVVDVVDGEHDEAYAQRVRRRVLRLGSDCRRRVELRQLDPAVAAIISADPLTEEATNAPYQPDRQARARSADMAGRMEVVGP